VTKNFSRERGLDAAAPGREAPGFSPGRFTSEVPLASERVYICEKQKENLMAIQDVTYRHARRADLSLIDVMSLPIGMPKKDRPQDLTCAGCGQPVRPRLGEKRPRHFYHYRPSPSHSCSGETYLHQAGKRALAEAMEALIATGRPLTLFHPAGVRHLHYTWEGDLYRSSPEKREIRVPTRGATVEVERGELGFVADVRMRSGADTIFLEVAVTHPCSPEKVASGIRILEFDIHSEADIERMVARVRAGNLQVGGQKADARTFNLGFGEKCSHVDRPEPSEVTRAANEILAGLFRSGQTVTLLDGSRRVVPQRRLLPDGTRDQPVTAATESSAITRFGEALQTYDGGLLALLPEDPGRAAEIVLRHRSGRSWVPDLIPVNPFTRFGGLDPAIPAPVRDRICTDGTVDAWRERYGIVERDAPDAPAPSIVTGEPTPPPPVRTRDMTFSRSRRGRLSATSDGRTFGAPVGTFPIDERKPDIWALDQVVRGRVGRVGFVRSCLSCRHHAFSHDEKKPIFCFLNRTSCHQTEAVTCTSWSPIREEADLDAHRRRVAESPKAPEVARLMVG